METQKTEIESLELGHVYKFDDLIQDSIPTIYGDMHILKLVKGDQVIKKVKAPKDLLKFIDKTPNLKAFRLRKIVREGEYINYLFDLGL